MPDYTTMPGDRGKARVGGPIEKCVDSAFVRDSNPLYFGNDGDISIIWDSTNSRAKLTGFPVGISDVDPGLSDALFFVSDATSGKYLLAISAG